MVRIRYAELPAGLHVATQTRGRYTIVYLLPGLTPAQRKDALTVARRSARLGHGPSLPAAAMAVAILADRVRTGTGSAVAALRKHPMLLLPVALLVACIVALMLSVVTAGVGVGDSDKAPESVQLRQEANGQLPASPRIGRRSQHTAGNPAASVVTPEPNQLAQQAPSGSTAPTPAQRTPNPAPMPTPGARGPVWDDCLTGCPER